VTSLNPATASMSWSARGTLIVGLRNGSLLLSKGLSGRMATQNFTVQVEKESEPVEVLGHVMNKNFVGRDAHACVLVSASRWASKKSKATPKQSKADGTRQKNKMNKTSGAESLEDSQSDPIHTKIDQSTDQNRQTPKPPRRQNSTSVSIDTRQACRPVEDSAIRQDSVASRATNNLMGSPIRNTSTKKDSVRFVLQTPHVPMPSSAESERYKFTPICRLEKRPKLDHSEPPRTLPHMANSLSASGTPRRVQGPQKVKLPTFNIGSDSDSDSDSQLREICRLPSGSQASEPICSELPAQTPSSYFTQIHSQQLNSAVSEDPMMAMDVESSPVKHGKVPVHANQNWHKEICRPPSSSKHNDANMLWCPSPKSLSAVVRAEHSAYEDFFDF